RVTARGARERRDQARTALIARGVEPWHRVSRTRERRHQLHPEPAAVRQPLDERRSLLGECQGELLLDVVPAGGEDVRREALGAVLEPGVALEAGARRRDRPGGVRRAAAQLP